MKNYTHIMIKKKYTDFNEWYLYLMEQLIFLNNNRQI